MIQWGDASIAFLVYKVPILKKQLKFDEAYRNAGLLAIPRLGGCPGTINVEARYAVELLDRVEKILLREGWGG